MDELRKWLEDSPFDFGAGLAARALYRAFPIAINNSLPKSWFEENGPKLFHGLFVLATTIIMPVRGHKFSAKLANDLNLPGAMSASSAAFYSSALRAAMRNVSANNKVEKIGHAIAAITAIEKLVTAQRQQLPELIKFCRPS